MTDPVEMKDKYDRARKRATEIYTDTFITDLAAQFGISEPAQIADLTSHLCEAATIYLIQQDAEKAERGFKPSALKREFKLIADQANALSKLLESTSGVAQELLWGPLWQVPFDIYLDPEIQKYHGWPVARFKNSDGAISTNIPNEVQVQNAVSLIEQLAKFATKRLQVDKGGRPSSHALWMWISNLREFWTKGLGRKFTRYGHKADPITEAHHFCVKAIGELDPLLVPQIGSVMREVIHNEGVIKPRPKKRKPTPENR